MGQSVDNPSRAALPGRRQKLRSGKLQDRNLLTLIALLAVLAVNATCYYLGIWQIYWGSCTVILCCTAIPFLVTWRSPLAGYFCFPNVFVGLLALFHIGYYVPVRLGWMRSLGFMPSVDDPIADLAMTLYCCAFLSFALGVSWGIVRAGSTRTQNPSSGGGQRPASNAILGAGAFIILINLLLFAVFLIQIGGFDKITVLSYRDYIDFSTYEDPRFLFTFVQFLPVGLLLVYVGLSSRKAVRRNLFYLDVSSILYIGWLTLIGARGPAFLFAVGVLYVRHICYRRLSTKVVAAAAITFLLAIPIVASYRNLPTDERTVAVMREGFDPVAGILEMGGTYRTLYAFSAVFGSGRAPLLMGESYLKAAGKLLPNLGLHKDDSRANGYYRSNAWITAAIEPISAPRTLGDGSTGIGEPFGNFGYFGVVGFFALLGFGLAWLEIYSLTIRSVIGSAVLASIFIPVNWYVRDDIFGVARAVAWPLATILFAYLIFSSRAKKPGKAGYAVLSHSSEKVSSLPRS
jgi:oligosaccharide repeat unit polymerase